MLTGVTTVLNEAINIFWKKIHSSALTLAQYRNAIASFFNLSSNFTYAAIRRVVRHDINVLMLIFTRIPDSATVNDSDGTLSAKSLFSNVMYPKKKEKTEMTEREESHFFRSQISQ